MGEVWRATDTSLGRPVAIKVLKSEYADDPLFRSRFETEARHAASLHHPGVASVYDVGESAFLGREDGSGIPRPFLVMELVDGQPLSALLRGGRALDPDVVRDLMAQTADALGAAHRAGIVHRDVKPANLMVTPDRQIKITDFGIARASDGLGLTGTGQVMGTPQYLSPEQARGMTATPASDVYALGVVAFECLVGHRPFDADSPVATALAHLNDPVPTLPPSVPADLAIVVRRAMAKEPEQRFADGDAFAAALRNPASAAPLTAPPGPADAQTTQVIGAVPPVVPVPLDQPDPWRDPEPLPSEPEPRRTWLLVVLVLAVVAAVVLVFVLIATAGDDDSGDEPQTRPTRSTGPASSAPPSSEDTPSQPSSSAPAEVTVDEDEYLGRPLDDVVSDLKRLGLEVETQEVDNPGEKDPGTVALIRPDGTLREGDTVTVGYYGEAPESDTPTPTPSNTPSPTQSDSPNPQPSSTPPTPSQSANQTPSAPATPSASQVAGSASPSGGAS
ncbi:serine/threonine protein kinase [Nocardioides anomalus]|uniref:non-specific serine/threonine protein kinase n=2 Tax=Nocardioides anomalus TaxID=2712223 RepID=A0A6G6WLT7_9ACTN|nr:serine/threonine protein kinase [Nocardioides anomalus]